MEVNDLLSTGVVAAIIILIFLSTVRRLLDLPKVPWIVWPIILLASAMPSYMAYTVLNPGEIFDKAEVRAQKDTFKLDIPCTILIIKSDNPMANVTGNVRSWANLDRTPDRPNHTPCFFRPLSALLLILDAGRLRK